MWKIEFKEGENILKIFILLNELIVIMNISVYLFLYIWKIMTYIIHGFLKFLFK